MINTCKDRNYNCRGKLDEGYFQIHRNNVSLFMSSLAFAEILSIIVCQQLYCWSARKQVSYRISAMCGVCFLDLCLVLHKTTNAAFLKVVIASRSGISIFHYHSAIFITYIYTEIFRTQHFWTKTLSKWAFWKCNQFLVTFGVFDI